MKIKTVLLFTALDVLLFMVGFFELVLDFNVLMFLLFWVIALSIPIFATIKYGDETIDWKIK